MKMRESMSLLHKYAMIFGRNGKGYLLYELNLTADHARWQVPQRDNVTAPRSFVSIIYDNVSQWRGLFNTSIVEKTNAWLLHLVLRDVTS